MRKAGRYSALRRRLRPSRPEVASATGYSLGHVSRWSHTGASAVDPPADAVATLAALLRERALRGLADLDTKAA